MHGIRRGITILEVLLVLFIMAVIVAVLMPAASYKRPARVMVSQSNLRQLAIGGANIAANNDERIVAYDLPGFASPLPETPRDGVHRAQLRQAEILRQATGRIDGPNAIEVDETHIAQNRYLHIPLIATMTGQLPEPVVVSPMDNNHLDFQEYAGRADYDVLPGGEPCTSFGSWTREQAVNRWSFASSYQSTVSAWSPDEPDEDGTLPVRPGPDASTLVVDRDRAVAPRRMDEVAFTSSKAMFFEEFDYTRGMGIDGAHFSDPDARINVQFFDSSVRRITTIEATAGWDPTAPCDQGKTSVVRYRPIDTRYFPGETPGPARMQPYRWTRGGLKGIDDGGNAATPDWCD